MRKLKIVDTEGHALWSHGNGLAYTLVRSSVTCEPDDENSIFIQGDDAAAFRQDWENLEKAQPDWHTDRIMRELWGFWSA